MHLEDIALLVNVYCLPTSKVLVGSSRMSLKVPLEPWSWSNTSASTPSPTYSTVPVQYSTVYKYCAVQYSLYSTHHGDWGVQTGVLRDLAHVGRSPEPRHLVVNILTSQIFLVVPNNFNISVSWKMLS